MGRPLRRDRVGAYLARRVDQKIQWQMVQSHLPQVLGQTQTGDKMKDKMFNRAAAFMCHHNGRKATPTIGITCDDKPVKSIDDTGAWMSLGEAIRLRASLDKAIKYVQAKRARSAEVGERV
jgi:hypothetical protein